MCSIQKFRWSIPAQAALVSLATLIAVAGCSTTGGTRSESRLPDDAPPVSYMQVVRSNSGPLQLQIALRELRPAKDSGPAIWLVAVSHIGETNYYEAVQRHLDVRTLVLFEGVSDRRTRHPQDSRAGPRLSNNELMKGRDDSVQSSLQSTLASSLGLAFQLNALDYDRPHFQNSDLTIPEMQALLSENAGSGQAQIPGAPGKSDDQLSDLVGIMDGSSVLGAILHAGVKLLGSSPKLQALTKVAVIELFGNLEGDISQSPALPSEMKRLIDVLIQGRNRVVVNDLKAELPKLRKRDSVAVFYGAGHMHDLETRIRSELNYRPASQLWLTAITVDPHKAGVTDAELRMIQSVVKWQLQALQPKVPAEAK